MKKYKDLTCKKCSEIIRNGRIVKDRETDAFVKLLVEHDRAGDFGDVEDRTINPPENRIGRA